MEEAPEVPDREGPGYEEGLAPAPARPPEAPPAPTPGLLPRPEFPEPVFVDPPEDAEGHWEAPFADGLGFLHCVLPWEPLPCEPQPSPCEFRASSCDWPSPVVVDPPPDVVVVVESGLVVVVDVVVVECRGWLGGRGSGGGPSSEVVEPDGPGGPPWLPGGPP